MSSNWNAGELSGASQGPFLQRPTMSGAPAHRGSSTPRISAPMKPLKSAILTFACLLFAAGGSLHAKVPPEKRAQIPAPATRAVDFNRDIRPILEASCVKCHGHGKSKGGFQLDTRETFLKPGDTGPAVVVGKSGESLLIDLVSGLDEDNVMPQKGTKLTAEQVGLLRAWIDQGLAWDARVSFGREPHRNLKPHKPELPPTSSAAPTASPVDRFVSAYFQQHGITPPPVVDEALFARRVFLDVVGLVPTPEEMEAFRKDARPDKRARLVAQLLGDEARYAQNWLTFWNDLLRNDYKGTGYIDGGREQITKWLYSALRDNQPYDALVRELINPGEKGPKGFSKGIVWRGVVNASQTPQLQAAQNIAQVFLGVNLKCASCHDSFIDDWQLADAYGMAGVYADTKLELVQCDRPLGKHAPVKFLFPEIGAMDDDAPKEQRIARLAELVTHRDNGRLPRTIVNRLWARFLGQGLVEPLDVMQNPAWNADLLDWLAEDLVEHGYDLKHTMARILTSQAYQLPSVNIAEGSAKDFVFRGPTIRRFNAEQFRDALAQLTGVWHDKPEGGLDLLLSTREGAAPSLPVDAFWVWSDAHAAEGVPPQTIYLRRSVTLDAVPAEAAAVLQADNSAKLFVNGREARGTAVSGWQEASLIDLRGLLRPGTNVFAIEARNDGEGANPAGALFYARLRPAAPAAPLDFASDAAWQVTTNKVENWQKPETSTEGWAAAQVLGPTTLAPWNVAPTFLAAVQGALPYGKVRASLVGADTLALALGRPNREQVMTQRASVATTLQALELTNGETLARLLRQGAEKLVSPRPNGERLVQTLFATALGRPPTAQEASLARELVGEEPKAEAVEDLLWAVAMLPEFQLIL